ncbi:MAG TPA: hypothetical protein VFS31_11430 [Chitinophagaceae bacterium]|nr:hypothetical protein [Chitinophagaceae bacterium]
MVYDYVVTLKNQQSRYLDLLGFLLSFSSMLFFIRELLLSEAPGLAYLLGAIFIALLLAWNLYRSLRLHKKVFYSRALLIAALVWMKMPYFQWLSFVFIMLALMEYQAKYAVEIGFSANEIVMNRLFRKRFSWNQFQHIVLKDGLLTLDFTNNKILQREIEEDEEDDADEDEFNQYCAHQLATHSQPGN